MTRQEIDNYVKNHAKLVNGALKSIHIKMTNEEWEDAGQELYLTMLHCLNNYNPEYKTSIDRYVSASLYARAKGIVKERFSGARGRDIHTKSLSDIIANDGEYIPREDTICDQSRPFEDCVDVKALMSSIIDKLDGESREMIVAWSEGVSVTAIAEMMGISVPWAWERIRGILDEMREIIG